MTQAGRHAETRKRVDIYKSASVACACATDAGQTVCDTDRQAGTRKRVDIYKSASVACALDVHDRLFVTQAETQKFDIYKIVG